MSAMNAAAQKTSSDTTVIRPFHVNVPEAELAELRRRINATRFPEKEAVSDYSQGVPLATVQKLARVRSRAAPRHPPQRRMPTDSLSVRLVWHTR